MEAGRWTSDALPQAQRAEAARAMLSAVHLPWALDLPDRARYACDLAWRDVGGCALVECRSAPLAGRREAGELRRTERDHCALLMVLSGEEHVRQGETAERLGAGDLLLWDGSRPIRFEVLRPLHKVTLLVPCERLSAALGADAPRGPVRLDGRSGLGALAAGHLAALARVAADLPGDHAALAADIVVDLLARLAGPAAAPPRAGDLLSRVLAHVEDHLADQRLTPSRIAARFGITPRYLHMLVSATGTTLSAHIRSRRLAAMRRDLADPRLAHRSITEIALAWGFADAAHASRAFSAAYGMAPSRWRAARR